MAVEGTLDLFRLPEILQLISQQQKTGILTVQGQNDIVAISFLNGRIVAADALNQTMEEGLCRVLQGEGILGAAELARANAEHQDAGGRLVDLLVERGYVSRPRLLEALRLQTGRLVEQLLRWDQGDFKFYSGDEVSYEEGLVPIPVEDLLLQAGAAGFGPPEKPAASPPAPARAAALRPAARTGGSGLPAVPSPAPSGPPGFGAAAARAAVEPAIEHLPAGPSPGPARRPERPAAASAPGPRPAPAEAAGPFRKMKVEQAAVPRADRRIARVLALAAAVLLAAALVGRASLVLPFPWQSGQRQDLARAQRAALYLKIDRAAKTYHLLEGQFPESLVQLRDAGLLGAGDLRDAQGHLLRYAAQGDSYTLQPLVEGKPLDGAEAIEAVTGNFLLDPEFITLTPDQRAPLVLLD